MITFLKAYLKHDPAAKSMVEIFFLYPAPKAILLHRISNWLYRANVPFIPRLFSEISRFITGIEIHPGATIGKNFFIDHGMGIVIGETAIIEDDVIMYHGVTLGGAVGAKKGSQRHPYIESEAILGAGAKIIGAIRIGKGARVGANSVVLKDVAAGVTVVGIPAEIKANK